MDRSIIAPYRAEEKELSHILYTTIQGLFLIYPPSAELRKCLSEEMFIKSNQQAFFHIMHYLFRIFDAQEFKKRFFWPITDKRSESNFRTSTVEYLKFINEKYHLNWVHIKSYLVVMPGGMKFISFLLDFVKFIVEELVKQKEKQLNLEGQIYRLQVSERNLRKMYDKNVVFKDLASEFIDTIENLNKKYDVKSQKLMQTLETLAQESGLSVDLLTDDKFLKDFEEYNSQLFDRFYSDRTKNVLEMENLVSELKEAMEKFYSKESGYKYDAQRIFQHLKRIKDHFSIDVFVEKESVESTIQDDGVNINTLISAFNVINETIQNELRICNKTQCVGELVFSRLLNLKNELQEMETEITSFQITLLESIKKYEMESSHTPLRTNINDTKTGNLENTLLMKLVSTPPIKFEVPEGGGKSRLALVDAKSGNRSETNFNNFLAPSRATSSRQLNRNHSLVDQTISDLNDTMNGSKIIDPMQLLRCTTKKDSTKYKMNATQLNISNLGSKWKQRQSILNDKEYEEHIVGDPNSPRRNFIPTDMNKTSPQSLTKLSSHTTVLRHSPLTPFSSDDRTGSSTHQIDSSIVDGGNCSSSLNYGKKLSAVKKVQDATLKFVNFSTSPSGRLDPLVSSEDFDIPKLKLNDISLIEQNIISKSSVVYEIPKLPTNFSVNNTAIKDENDDNSANMKQCENIADKIYDREEDALFNISDSVLKDVTL